MTDQVERYDRIAAGYARWWAPVLAPGVEGLLNRVGSIVTAGASRLIDIGTGTGQLALGALARWPQVSVAAVDASAEMRAMADANAGQLPSPDRSRYRSETALADALPFEDGAFDLALSSFVFQLVPNRARALREARRVLRPGGSLAYVSWLSDNRAFEPDRIFDEVLDSLDIGARDWDDGRPGDLPSVERAAGELRHAGFAGAVAEAEFIEHRFTVEGYIGFLSEFDEETLFEELDSKLRARLVRELDDRLRRLPADQLTMRYPIVFASGRRSGA